MVRPDKGGPNGRGPEWSVMSSRVVRKIIQSSLCCLPLIGCARASLYYAKPSGDPVAQSYQAYLQGVAAGLSGTGPELESHRGRLYCPPPGTVIGPSESVAIRDRYGRVNGTADDPDAALLLALAAAFPC